MFWSDGGALEQRWKGNHNDYESSAGDHEYQYLIAWHYSMLSDGPVQDRQIDV